MKERISATIWLNIVTARRPDDTKWVVSDSGVLPCGCSIWNHLSRSSPSALALLRQILSLRRKPIRRPISMCEPAPAPTTIESRCSLPTQASMSSIARTTGAWCAAAACAAGCRAPISPAANSRTMSCPASGNLYQPRALLPPASLAPRSAAPATAAASPTPAEEEMQDRAGLPLPAV